MKMKRVFSDNTLHENGLSGRRKLLKSMAALGSCFIIQSLGPKCFAIAATQSTGASDEDGTSVQYKSGDFSIDCYLVKPKGVGRHPGVIIVHSLAGVDNHIKDLMQELAAQGFVAFAPNLASGRGIPIKHLDPLGTVEDLKLGYEYLASDPNVDKAKISVIGFGWGAWRAFKLAEQIPELYRVVVYYGSTPIDGMDSIKTPIQAHYAEHDYRITGNAPWIDRTMKELNKKFSYDVYDNTDADFMNDPSSDAAKTSWQKTLAFLKSSS
jgi:carboxymethylenebutenolidase